jgi:hypothetical protein
VSLELARTVADAVLYEGYLLYPYRASSTKNQARWQWGVLGPAGASKAGVGEDASMHTECLVRPGAAAQLRVHLRFLQLQSRVVERAEAASPTVFTPVDALVVDGADLRSWDEAVEHSVELGPYALSELATGPSGAGPEAMVRIAGGEEVRPVGGDDGRPVGQVIRRRWPLEATVGLTAAQIDDHPGVVRLGVGVRNLSPWSGGDRHGATRASLLGAHLLLQLSDAEFISLLEPPDGLGPAAAACRQERCWPVLVGVEGQTDIVLASPIILYDYPAVAPESAGALFDSTEIDEILTLRVLTLTDEEKAEARATDPAAAAIIDRCEQMTPEAMQQLHGVLRDPRPSPGRPADDGAAWSALEVPTFVTPGAGTAPGSPSGAPWWDPGVDASVSPETDSVVIDGVAVAKGSVVRLHPRRHADAQDLFFADRSARVTGVLFDVDGAVHVAVVLTDDPAADLHEWYGRYLYFAPEEIQPLEPAPASPLPEQKEKDQCEPLES